MMVLMRPVLGVFHTVASITIIESSGAYPFHDTQFVQLLHITLDQ